MMVRNCALHIICPRKTHCEYCGRRKYPQIFLEEEIHVCVLNAFMKKVLFAATVNVNGEISFCTPAT